MLSLRLYLYPYYLLNTNSEFQSILPQLIVTTVAI
nr:MAG TPA: hypothetical protein [Crassvirales sp.]